MIYAAYFTLRTLIIMIGKIRLIRAKFIELRYRCQYFYYCRTKQRCLRKF